MRWSSRRAAATRNGRRRSNGSRWPTTRDASISQALLRTLAGRGINELHVEAGAKLNGALLRAGLIDELLIYFAGALIGDPARGMFEFTTPLASLGQRIDLEWSSIERLGGDLRIVARVKA